MTIMFTCRVALMRQHVLEAGLQDRVVIHAPPLPIPYGTHHSKAFLLEYEGGMRLIVHTANLIYPDNNNKTQGLWFQDFPPKVCPIAYKVVALVCCSHAPMMLCLQSGC